ncbi:hypothetical protein CMO96_03810 [Candidatus Woesebacteria bacterium]|nr:hypothetical protein [Candidatus Woesebacteria bacterium]
MKESLLRFNKDQKYLIFDYETCHLNLVSEDNKPWQLAYRLIQGDRLLDEADHWLYWEDLHVSEGAARVTGWTKTKYKKNAKDPAKALDAFEEHLYDKDVIPVGHNILGFDVYIHNIHRKLLKRKTDYSYIHRCIDTVCLGKAIKKEIKLPKEENRLAWQYRLTNFIERKLKVNLKQCCKDYGITFNANKLHNALYDIKMNEEVFKKMLWDIEI